MLTNSDCHRLVKKFLVISSGVTFFKKEVMPLVSGLNGQQNQRGERRGLSIFRSE